MPMDDRDLIKLLQAMDKKIDENTARVVGLAGVVANMPDVEWTPERKINAFINRILGRSVGVNEIRNLAHRFAKGVVKRA